MAAVLIQWKADEEGAARLRRAGCEVTTLVPSGPASLRALRDAPPDVLVIDLSRLPSQGRDVAIILRRQAATRRVPLVFVGGEAARLRELLPDAVYTTWDEIGPAVRRAVRDAPPEPVAPKPMAAYAESPLPKKLGIKPGVAVALMGAPAGFEDSLGELPGDVRISRAARRADLILLFTGAQADLARRFPGAASRLNEGGGLWVIWPKKASGRVTNLTQATVRKFGLGQGFVDYKICAVDETWSGLLFARRKSRPGLSQS